VCWQKESGLVLAARFYLFVGMFQESRQIAQRLISGGNSGNGATVFEMEAQLIDYWCLLEDSRQSCSEAGELRRMLAPIESAFSRPSANSTIDLQDLDALLLWSSSRAAKGSVPEAVAVLNQAIALSPTFLPAHSDKCLLLACAGDWEPALDSAQRLLDMDNQHLDGLHIIALYAFTHESQVEDAIQKVEDLDNALRAREGTNAELTTQYAALFSSLCGRQSRVLSICVRMLERVLKSSVPMLKSEEARLYTELGYVLLLQGPAQHNKAMKCFRESSKRDASNVKTLLGLVMGLVVEGAAEDAEAQIELLTLMHSEEELGYILPYLQAKLLQHQKNRQQEGLEKLLLCISRYTAFTSSAGIRRGQEMIAVELGGRRDFHLYALHGLYRLNADFCMSLVLDLFSYIDNTGSTTGSTMVYLLSNPSTATAAAAAVEDDDTEAQRYRVSLLDGSSSGGSATEGLEHEDSPGLLQATALLQQLLQYCPGFISAYIELSRVFRYRGLSTSARRALGQALAFQPQHSGVLLLLAQLEATTSTTTSSLAASSSSSTSSNVQQAERLLDQALACDFSIRSVPKYRLVRGLLQGLQGRLSEALEDVEAVLQAADIHIASSAGSNATSDQHDHASPSAAAVTYTDPLRLLEEDRVCVCILYASLLHLMHRTKESTQALTQSKIIFADTASEMLLLLASAQLQVYKGDYDAAIRILDKISTGSSTSSGSSAGFTQAIRMKAEILLLYTRDREGYIKCFEALRDHNSGSMRAYILLGDAYIRVLNCEQAIEAYLQGLRIDKRNVALCIKTGRAMIASHEYHRAVDFYESRLRENSSNSTSSSERVTLAHDLAKLYLQLDRLDAAERVLQSLLSNTASNSSGSSSSSADSQSLLQEAASLKLLVKVYKGKENFEDVLLTLRHLHTIYKQLYTLSRTGSSSGASSSGSSSSSNDMNVQLAEVCTEIAEVVLVVYEKSKRSEEEALQFLEEALRYHPHCAKALLALGKLYKLQHQVETAIVELKKVVMINDSATIVEALLLLVDCIYTTSSDAAAAVEPLLTYIDTHCTTSRKMNYILLEKTIVLLRRAGRLADVKVVLMNIESREKHSKYYLQDAGYHYCVGLYNRYINDISKAILEFNYCRRCSTWASKALTHMIELYLNPDQDGIWEVIADAY
jgi:tetratricopeptide (TPR) repeat protein